MSESPPFQSPFHSPLSELIILLVQFTAGRSGDDVRLQGRDRERGGGGLRITQVLLAGTMHTLLTTRAAKRVFASGCVRQKKPFYQAKRRTNN
jgi:hypothetical protein